MSKLYERLNDKKTRDISVLSDFIYVFCRENHIKTDKVVFSAKDEKLRRALYDKRLLLCTDCSRLLNYGIAKLLLCPYDPKPSCRKCQTHCYAPGYREKIKEVMRFSGKYLVKHGRFHLLTHYLFR